MNRALFTALAITISIVFLGCARVSQESKNRLDEKADRNLLLTADSAKQALLEMDPGQIRPGVLVPPPRDEPIQMANADEISIGIYHCNLKERTFDATAVYKGAARHAFNHVSGVFERNDDGKWIAKITASSSGH